MKTTLNIIETPFRTSSNTEKASRRATICKQITKLFLIDLRDF